MDEEENKIKEIAEDKCTDSKRRSFNLEQAGGTEHEKDSNLPEVDLNKETIVSPILVSILNYISYMTQTAFCSSSIIFVIANFSKRFQLNVQT